jgi:hypothetical protein
VKSLRTRQRLDLSQHEIVPLSKLLGNENARGERLAVLDDNELVFGYALTRHDYTSETG